MEPRSHADDHIDVFNPSNIPIEDENNYPNSSNNNSESVTVAAETIIIPSSRVRFAQNDNDNNDDDDDDDDSSGSGTSTITPDTWIPSTVQGFEPQSDPNQEIDAYLTSVKTYDNQNLNNNNNNLLKKKSTLKRFREKLKSGSRNNDDELDSMGALIRKPPSSGGYQKANWFSKLFFLWMDPLVALGYRRPLHTDDLWELPEKHNSSFRVDKFLTDWTAHEQDVDAYNQKLERDHAPNNQNSDDKKKKGCDVLGVLFKLHRKNITFTGLLTLLMNAVQFGSPYILQAILKYLVDPSAPVGKGYGLAFAFFITTFVGGGLCQSHNYMILFSLGMDMRTEVATAVYQKALSLSSASRQKTTVGELVNLVSNDAQRFAEATPMFHAVWSAPIVIIIAIALLIDTVGVSALAGLALLILLIPLQGYLAGVLSTIRKETIILTDQRVKFLNEIIQGIKVIKFYAWEDSFKNKIMDLRNAELAFIRKTAYIRAINLAILLCVPTLVSVVTLLVYSATGGNLSPYIVFTALNLMYVLRMPLFTLPMAIALFVQLKVSAKRVNAFLVAEEVSKTDYLREYPKGVPPEQARDIPPYIEINQGRFSWHNKNNPNDTSSLLPEIKIKKKKQKQKSNSSCWPSSKKNKISEGDAVMLNEPIINGENDENQLQDPGKQQQQQNVKIFELNGVNVRVSHGQLIAVVGSVGSGKSSLMSALLGQMTKLEGTTKVRGSIAYVAQSAWIVNATLRDNILFGKEFDEKKYKKTIHCCELERDISILPGGDLTEIGEKGINLSGGQKQRVAIARAVYNDADIYLFDDPLSAVDGHVGANIFKRCISGMLRTKTRLLVTNQLQYLKNTDSIIMVKDGRIEEQGTYEQLLGNSVALQRMMKAFDGSQGKAKDEGKPDATQLLQEKSAMDEQSHMSFPADSVDYKEKEKKGTKLVQEEERNTGSVALSVYKQYMRAAGGYSMTLVILLGFVFAQAAQIGADMWLSKWSEDYMLDPPGVDARLGHYSGIYAALGFGYGLITFVRSVLFAVGTVLAAQTLHANMYIAVNRAPMSFFDTTPIGRILNRFSRDTDVCDSLLPPVFEQFLTTSFNVLGVFVLISVVVPWFLIAVGPLLLFYYVVQLYYRRTSRELQRVENVNRSPIYAHFSESLNGVATIRAFDVVDRFYNENYHRQDAANKAYFLLQASYRWLQIRLELLGSTIMLIVACLCVASKTSDLIPISVGDAGVILTYSVSLTVVMNWALRMSTETEAKFNSVERLIEYSEVPQEAAAEIEETRPPQSWPQNGEIKIENLQLRYRPELDLVLKGVNLDVAGESKLGVAGRTGSGKSSLMVALFRLVEPCGGRIIIDGIDIATLGLNSLRKKIGIIPQDPVVFSGNVRFNLDPFHEFSDAQIWRCLEHAHLKVTISEMEGQLDGVVSEGGDNFSVGQKQLICLARALLRSPKILVLDECTANIDIETDAFLQQGIKREFNACTTLTIAHRLNTIMESTKILVMSDGMVAEYDSPENLLSQEGSHFGQMVRANQGHRQNRDD